MTRPPQFPSMQPPKSEKANQHFIPRWWLKGFAGPAGDLQALKQGKVRVVGVAKVMSGDWIYTVFDTWWRPSDALEDALSKIEGDASQIFASFTSVGATREWDAVIWFIALSVARHPSAMGRLHELSKDFAVFLMSEIENFSDFHSFSAASHARFGAAIEEAEFVLLKGTPSDQREASALHIIELQPYDKNLPQTDALLATPLIYEALRRMECHLLHAPASATYVLSDRPTPTAALTAGFSIPISARAALKFIPGTSAIRSERTATAAEVTAINEAQASRTSSVLVGPDPAQLSALAPFIPL